MNLNKSDKEKNEDDELRDSEDGIDRVSDNLGA